MIIDRRSFLESLALSSLSPGVVRSSAPQPAEVINREQGDWFIARQNSDPGAGRVVEFWSKPYCAIDYRSQLPSEITRGRLWGGKTTCTDFQVRHGRLNCINPISAEDPSEPVNDWPIFIKAGHGIENLQKSLFGAVGGKTLARTQRTALLALDSLWPSPVDLDWVDMLPAFRSCYDRVIGHFHIQQRGFHHWKRRLSAPPFEASYFERFFTNTVAQCDVVILTSQSLIENDLHLSARASTETLVGELMRRFGQALFDDGVLTEITPIDTASSQTNRPRIFALGSAGASVTAPQLVESDLIRQRELVLGSFGKPMACPLVIATCIDNNSAEAIHRQFVGTNMKLVTMSGRQRNDLEWLEFVTLWPFDPDYGPWPD